MKTCQQKNAVKTLGLFVGLSCVFWLQPALLKADVVVLQNGTVITGNILQQDASGALIQMDAGTFRYPLTLIKEMKKEAAAAPHVSNNVRTIPDWAQIVSRLATNAWADGLKQVPATVINYGVFNNVPYISFRCASGGYEVNIFGDLNAPAAIQIGAMTYLKDDAVARSNCVNFVCSVLANAADRKAVRALDLTQKQVTAIGNMTIQTIMPGEWGSYGGWWVSVQDMNALGGAQASAAELNNLTQSPGSTPPSATEATAAPTAGAAPATVSQPVTTTTTSTETYYNNYYGYGYRGYWTQEELGYARPVQPIAPVTASEAKPASTAYPEASQAVYPRSYNRTAGTYDRYRR